MNTQAIEVSNLNNKQTGVTLSQPVSMEAAYKMCQVLAKSDLVPRAYRGKPENIFLAHIAGQPFGFDVTMAMRSFHIIEGQPTLKPEIQVALVRQAGHSITVKHSSTDEVVIVGRRSDTGDTAESRYSLEDAKRANLLGKGNWKTYPEDMLFARAVSRLCRRLFQDVLLGCAYVPEELGAEVNADGDVISVTPARELVSQVTVADDFDEVVEVEELAEANDVELAYEQDASVDVGAYGEDATQAQIARIHILKSELGISDEKYRAALSRLTGATSSKDLTRAQADVVIENLTSARRSVKTVEVSA